MRRFHSVFALCFGFVIMLLAISGSILAIVPIKDAMQSEVQEQSDQSIAQVLSHLTVKPMHIEQLRVKPSGSVVVRYQAASGNLQEGFVDIGNGTILGPVTPSAGFFPILTGFHRSFLAGEMGRIVVGGGALALLFLAISGVFLTIKRAGGFRQIFAKPKGSRAAVLHIVLVRLAALPILITGLSGFYITLTEFELIPTTTTSTDVFPESQADLSVTVAAQDFPIFTRTPFAELRNLTFPMPGDPYDVFTLKTTDATLYLDQYSGVLLANIADGLPERAYNLIFSLHTGEGWPWVALLFGLVAMTLPVISVSGALIWWQRRKNAAGDTPANSPPQDADIILLVGSEGNSTWGFAATLHRTLFKAGLKTHTASMNDFTADYPAAAHVIFLAATYGNGAPPHSAANFLARLKELQTGGNWCYSVLGFGDQSFPQYCQFAKDVDQAMALTGAQRFMDIGFINRQSSQAFAIWGQQLGEVLQLPLILRHIPSLPRTHKLTLVSRQVYGVEVQAPTVVLRFVKEATNRKGWWQIIRSWRGKAVYHPGDLLGILPPGAEMARFYSIASAPSRNHVEICVKKHIGGTCSGFLHNLEPGDKVDGFTAANPGFQITPGHKPVIMIAAGTGIAPLIGFIRANANQRPMHLFWGGRAPNSDFLFQEELDNSLIDNRLSSLKASFSRTDNAAYVQDGVRQEASRLATMLAHGASVMVCGGADMAQAVMEEIEQLLLPVNLNVALLKQQGRYKEDVF